MAPSALFRRDDDIHKDHSDSNSQMTRNLLVTLVVLIAFGIALGVSLVLIRRARNARKEAGTLPSYEQSQSNGGRFGLTIDTRRNSAFGYSEKQQLIDNSSPMPLTPESVPEIRITFPEEEDQNGRRISGRVMVVQVGEAGVGFVKPLEQDGLPAYNSPTQATDRMASVDLERIGGLKEIR